MSVYVTKCKHCAADICRIYIIIYITLQLWSIAQSPLELFRTFARGSLHDCCSPTGGFTRKLRKLYIEMYTEFVLFDRGYYTMSLTTHKKTQLKKKQCRYIILFYVYTSDKLWLQQCRYRVGQSSNSVNLGAS